MKNEDGYVLVVTIVIICMITCSVLILTNRTVTAAVFALRRTETVKALAFAESAALEGLWCLQKDPSYRLSQSRYWTDGYYQFSIQDNSTDDLDLTIIGTGFCNNQIRKISLQVHRDNSRSTFQILNWEQLN